MACVCGPFSTTRLFMYIGCVCTLYFLCRTLFQMPSSRSVVGMFFRIVCFLPARVEQKLGLKDASCGDHSPEATIRNYMCAGLIYKTLDPRNSQIIFPQRSIYAPQS